MARAGRHLFFSGIEMPVGVWLQALPLKVTFSPLKRFKSAIS
ncbi:hypothetical protein AM1_3408 [Acaryochloris marina MBIC11017]|uniref:Uncharacterized protein n=1 Tax=Acaryochloris marina (strain MBIC 11017) TaxID=329726 RepID=B0C055_ACAM1|nr:hypothetical protein AM1_3408 [Acaryochloris marina MBIC11017]